MAMRAMSRVAVAQMTSIADKVHNYNTCVSLVDRAVTAGAQLLCLPECFAYLGTDPSDTVANAEPLDGHSINQYCQLAKTKRIWLSLGGFHEEATAAAGSSGGKVYNTNLLVDSDGEIRAVYRKIHLFDCELTDEQPQTKRTVLTESMFTCPGDEVVVAGDTPAGVMGLTTCYDIRFPELYRTLSDAGCETLIAPSAFTVPTGAAGHWEVLLRARAIESQCYVLAAAQVGRHNERRQSWGHALIIDPWGQILGDAGGDGDVDGSSSEERGCIICADLSRGRLEEVHRMLPVHSHRRRDLFAGHSLEVLDG